jgi:hypothetical protein
MKKSGYCLIALLIVVSCCKHLPNELEIRSNGDTLNYGTDFKAELFIPYHNGFLPAFKIIRGTDTSWLPIDTIKKCAILKAASNRSGEKEYNGIVEYIDLKGNRKSEKFSIKYYVKPKS